MSDDQLDLSQIRRALLPETTMDTCYSFVTGNPPLPLPAGDYLFRFYRFPRSDNPVWLKIDFMEHARFNKDVTWFEYRYVANETVFVETNGRGYAWRLGDCPIESP